MSKIKDFHKKANDFRSTIEKDTINPTNCELKLKLFNDLCSQVSNSGKIPEKFKLESTSPLNKEILEEMFKALSMDTSYWEHIKKYKNNKTIHCYFIYTQFISTQ